MACINCMYFDQSAIECRKHARYTNLKGFPFSRTAKCFASSYAVKKFEKGVLSDKHVDFLLSPAIFGGYVEKNKQLVYWLEEQDMDFNLPSLIAYIEAARAGKRYAATTVGIRKSQVKRIVTEISKLDPEHWTALDQFKIDQLFRSIIAQKKQTRQVTYNRILSRAELEEYMDHLQNQKLRVYLFARFLVETGCRVSEMTGVNMDNCVETTRGEREIRVLGKGQKERIVYISRELYQDVVREFHPNKTSLYPLSPLFLTTRGNRYTRQYISRELKVSGLRIIGRPVSAHRLRHSFATMLIEAGQPVKAVSEYLGHNNVSVTQDMYVHVDLDRQKIPIFEKRR